jgi:hypothetical protein
MSQIILIRHAKVDIPNLWIYSYEIKEYLELYNNSPISKEPIPKELRKLVESADTLATSELLRAKETLKLFNKAPDFTSSLFNESPLPYANFRLFKLPAKVWIIIYRIAWLFGFSKNTLSIKQERNIAKMAVKELLLKEKNILLIGHGVKNFLIAKELKKMGYSVIKKSDSKNLGYYIYNKKI